MRGWKSLTLKHAIVIGIIFGVVAAAVVWYLERFELNRLHGEMKEYLDRHRQFDDFIKNREGTTE